MAPQNIEEGASVDDSSHSEAADTKHNESQSGLEATAKTRTVKRLRLFVSILMVFTAVGFGSAVYTFTRKEERTDFELQ